MEERLCIAAHSDSYDTTRRKYQRRKQQHGSSKYTGRKGLGAPSASEPGASLSLSTSVFAFIIHVLSAGKRTYGVVITLASTASVYAPTCANPAPFRANITGEVAGLTITNPERSGQCVAWGVPLNV